MMRTGPTSTITIAAVCVAAAGIVVYCNRLSPSAREATVRDAAYLDQGDDSAASSNGHNEVLIRIRAKEEVTRALIRGELTFSDAAERFRELSSSDPAGLDRLRALYPAATNAELWHRQVIGYVNGFTRIEPVRVATLLPALEAELNRRFPPRAPAGTPLRPEGIRMSKSVPHIVEVTVSPGGRSGSRARPPRTQ